MKMKCFTPHTISMHLLVDTCEALRATYCSFFDVFSCLLGGILWGLFFPFKFHVTCLLVSGAKDGLRMPKSYRAMARGLTLGQWTLVKSFGQDFVQCSFFLLAGSFSGVLLFVVVLVCWSVALLVCWLSVFFLKKK